MALSPAKAANSSDLYVGTRGKVSNTSAVISNSAVSSGTAEVSFRQ